ncbi:NAD(P)-binding protein [Cylindrobasidium torrendii FP15055 ss-10]|uniref:NAD(P)-binding protein n=1 Tax=Cylindrobasidium torrendii FP15055 ss-10 TaxID=1314674 RepID=A0A0D7BQV6_9AGAR|nr:NAD(P)-binding protein [Cylindrobasidium torrendii FP15055 ss-10]
MLSLPGFALVTGSGNGIGRVIARSFAKAGAAGVHVADISKEVAQDASEEITSVATNPKFKALASVVDVSKEEDVKEMIGLTKSRFGRLDYAVNNAGIAEPARLTADVPIEVYDKVIAVNQRGVHLCMQAQLRMMRAQNAVQLDGDRPSARGAIINMSSGLGLVALEEIMIPSYATSKHAVVGMTRMAAVGYAQHNIRVNAVCPGYTSTSMMANEGLGDVSSMISRVPQRRFILPEEIADVVLFLASESASAVTGVAWAVCGGRSAV